MKMGVMMIYQQYHHSISLDQMFDRMLESWWDRPLSSLLSPLSWTVLTLLFRHQQELFKFTPEEAKERLVVICEAVCSPLAASTIRNAVF